MKIAVIGPQNTGKTTFVEDFLKEFNHYKKVEKTYRDIVRENELEINQKTSEKSQRAIMDFMWDTISQNEEKNIVFDRCIVDNYVYTLVAHKRCAIPKDFLIQAHTKMLDHIKYLDCIFFIPTSAGVKLVQDEQRDIDTDFIDDTNQAFLETLFKLKERFHIPIFVITGNREKRIERVKEILL